MAVCSARLNDPMASKDKPPIEPSSCGATRLRSRVVRVRSAFEDKSAAAGHLETHS